MNEKPDFTGAIGDDPFADMEADALQDLGIEAAHEAEEEAAQLDTPPPDAEKAAVSMLIPIEDDADMALARWLYLEESMSNAAEEAAVPSPAQDSAAQDLLDLLLSESAAPQVPDEET